MTERLKQFLRNSSTLQTIDEMDFQHVYDVANESLSIDEVGTMTQFFESTIGINPLEYMTRIPEAYFANIEKVRVVIPEGIKSIDDNAFTGANIASLYLPKSLTTFTDESFNDSNVAVVCIPTTIEDYINKVKIDAYAGAYNGAFKLGDHTGNIIHHLVITPSCKNYGSHFQDCTSIETIKFEEGVTDIPHYAFNGCHFLTTVELPSTMHSIGEDTFGYCVNLNKIIYNGTYEQFGEINFWRDWLNNGDGTEHWFTLVCKDGSYELEAGK